MSVKSGILAGIVTISLMGVGVSSTSATEMTDALQVSDQLFEQREITGNLAASIAGLSPLLEVENISTAETYAVLWRLSQRYSAVNRYTDWDKQKRLAAFKKGIEYGQKAQELKPNGVEGIYWMAINLGREAELKGILKSLSSVKPIRRNMEKIISIDPNFHRAYFVLARLYRKAPKVISIGDMNKAELFIREALSRDGQDTYYLVELAKIKQKRGDISTAIKTLEEVIQLMPRQNDHTPTVKHNQKEAQTLLNQYR